jgi:hypothetical protein
MEKIHPFPGLRPFEEDEEHLFFGREKSVIQLLSRLRISRFLAVIGTSGSGKSSLVKCGLLPSLYRGFMAGAGSRWRVALFRPGDNPVGNLAEALAKTGILEADTRITGDDADMAAIYGKFIETTLRRSHHGLIDVAKQSSLKPHENLLIVIDQFEELFRFSRLERNSVQDGKRDAVVFIKLLLESARQTGVPIYIILTMRSDFLGDCTEFRGLPEAINNGQYLVPRMTRDEKRAAVTGPAAVAGAEISVSLLSRVLNDVGDNPDHLPILQHALMRTWDYWLENQKEGEPLGLEHYRAIGTMESALSQHAEEAFAQLKTQRSRMICEKMFKLITDMEKTGRGVRRPAKISEICLATNASKEEVVEVIDVFRKPGRTFLMPPHGVQLDWESVIDISHESFMRIWTRLIDWVKEEARSAEMYLDLAKAAALNEEGRAALWRDPELMTALNWRDRNKPNAVWAGRYDPSFDRAVNFLEASKKQKELEIAEKEREQRAKIKRTRIFAAIISIAAVIAIVFAVWAIDSANKAREQKEKAQEQETLAKTREKEANEARRNEEEQKLLAQKKEQEADEARRNEKEQKILAQKKEQEANEQRAEAEKQKEIAEESAIMEEIQGLIVDMNKEEATFRQYLAKANELAALSISIAQDRDNELKALLALTAYRLNSEAYIYLAKKTKEVVERFDKSKLSEFRGNREITANHNELVELYKEVQDKSRDKRQPAEIFAALREAYTANVQSRDIIYRDVESWALAAPGGNNIIFSQREGKLLLASLQHPELTLPVINKKDPLLLSQTGTIIQAASFTGTSKDDRLFCGTLDGRLVYWEKGKWEEKRLPVKHQAKILAMAFSKNKNRLFYSVKNIIYMYGLNLGEKPEPIISAEEDNYILTLAVIEGPGSGDSFLIFGDEAGHIFQANISAGIKKKKINTTFKPGKSGFYAIAYDPGRKWLVLADARGEIHLFPGIDGKRLASAARIEHCTFDTKHKGIIDVLAFSPDGRYLASGGMDGSINLWNLNAKKTGEIARQAPAITITGKQKILSLVFDPKGDYFIFNDEHHLRICPTRPEVFYEKLCKGNKQGLTAAQWQQYIGETIKQEDINICPPLKK